MSSETQLSGITLANASDDSARTKLSEQLGDAVRRDGAVVVEVPRLADLYDAVQQAAASFFALTPGEKSHYYIGNSACHRGYVPFTEKGAYADEGDSRRYESFDVGLDLPSHDTHVSMGTPLMGANAWPELVGFRETVYGAFETLNALSAQLMTLLARYLGLHDQFFESLMHKPVSQLRLLHYPGRPIYAQEVPTAMGAHTDYEFFTLLDANDPGLELASHEDGWIKVAPPRGSVVMIAGDMLETVSNGLFRSALHRVADVNTERYSFPFFCGADFDAVIRPVTRNIRGARTPRYGAMQAGEYLLERFRRDFPYVSERYPAASMDYSPSSLHSQFEQRRLESVAQ